MTISPCSHCKTEPCTCGGSRLSRFNARARGRMKALLDDPPEPKPAPPMPERFAELDLPASEIRVGDWLLMSDGVSWMHVEEVADGVRDAKPSLMLLHTQGGFSNVLPDQVLRMRRPDHSSTEVVLEAAMYEAASIVCHRIAQCGWDSTEARDAHVAWSRAWLAWCDETRKEEIP